MLMHVLDRDFLRSEYDVLVVGAGIGGLTSAALLAKRGLKVLVVEQHYIPGGCASIFRRKGFTFDVGASLFFGFGENGYNPHQFVMNEIEEDISLVPMEETFTIHLDKSKKVSMYTDREKFWNEMCNCFPNESNNIKHLLTEFESFYTQSLDSYGGKFFAPAETPPDHGKNLLLTRPLYLIRLLRYLLSTQEQLFRRFIKDPQILKLFTLLNQNMTTCGLDQTPAIAGPMIHVESYTGGCYYAQGSPQVLANKLEKAIHKYGSQILYRNRVEKLLIENGEAKGCQLENGLKIKAGIVVSNATIWNLYGKLIDQKDISKRKRKWAQNFRPSYSIFGVYLGVTSDVIPEGIKPTQILPYTDAGKPSYLTVYITSLLDSEASPPGTHSLCIFLPESTPEKASPTDGKDKYHNRSYRENKQEKASEIIHYLDDNYFPGLERSILVQEIATPQTIQRYTLKSAGAIGGPQVNMRQSYMSRLAARSDWKRLYCVGDSTSQGIGVVSVTVSAISAVNAILQDLGEDEYIPLEKYNESYVHYKSKPKPSKQIKNDFENLRKFEASKTILKLSNCCRSPRCIKPCPDNSESGHISRLAEASNWIGAAQAIRNINPLPIISGYLSAKEDFCSETCSMNLCPDSKSRIKSLNQYICEKVPNYKPKEAPFNNFRICIVGAGTTGLICAHYLARLGYKVDIFEKEKHIGGRLRWLEDSPRIPTPVLNEEILSLFLPSICVHYGESLGESITIDELKNNYDSLFIACGLGGLGDSAIKMPSDIETVHGLQFLTRLKAKPSALDLGSIYTIVGSTFMAVHIAEVLIEAGCVQVNLFANFDGWDQQVVTSQELYRLEQIGVTVHPEASGEEFLDLLSISREVIVADAHSHVVEKRLEAYLLESLSIDEAAWAKRETVLMEPQEKVVLGGEMVRGAGSFSSSIESGRKAALRIDQKVRPYA